MFIGALKSQSSAMHQTGDYAAAQRVGQEMLGAARAVYGATHPLVADALFRVGEALGSQGTARSITEGATLTREALAMRRALSGDDHPTCS